MRNDRREEEDGRRRAREMDERTVLSAVGTLGESKWDAIADEAFPKLSSGHRYFTAVFILASLRNRGLIQKNAVTSKYSITAAGHARLAA